VTLSVVFMGTPDFAVPTLLAILGAGHDVRAVYTRAPRPAGRGMDERKSPVHLVAEAHGVPVRTPKTLRTHDAADILAADAPDVVVVVAYGLILPPAILAVPPLGCLNLHGSLLPRWRGAAPIQRAIMAGDTETGVMVMKMEEGLDTGPVAMAERVAIPPDATTADLHDTLMRLGADLIHRALGAAERGGLGFKPQPEAGVTYATKIEKGETRIDWTKPAKAVHDHVRGLSPFPGAWCEIAGERVKVLRSRVASGEGAPGNALDAALTIACGAGAVRLVEVQRAGGKPLAAEAFLRGLAVPAGTVLA
jgi:methionyl-tRNA formyltransferase